MPPRRRKSDPPRRRPAAQKAAVVYAGPTPWTRICAVFILATALALSVVVRLRIADTPLERDEGEYAYAGQLILQGTPPYELAYNMKFPGTYYAYAGLMAVFGQSPHGIRLGLLVVHVATVLVLFALGRRLIGELPAAAGAAMFAIFALDRWSMGVFAHATHFVLLPALAAVLVLLPRTGNLGTSRLFAAGVLAGLAVLMKQQAMAFALLAVVIAIWQLRRSGVRELSAIARRCAWLAAGGLTPFLLLVVVFAIQGVLGRFWFWTFRYAAAYVSETPLSEAWMMLGIIWPYISQGAWMLWYFAAAGLLLFLVTRWTAEARVVLLGWIAAATIAVSAGFFFRPHYFILLMPAAGLLMGVIVGVVERVVARRGGSATAAVVATVVFIAIAGSYVAAESSYLFRLTPNEVNRSVYQSNPFIEAVEIGKYLREHTTPSDRIAVVGSEPEIYFYANRKSATGYIYTYALMEQQPYASRMQDEMIKEIEAAKPTYLVFVSVASSWAATPASEKRILNWVVQYSVKCYERVGVADIDPLRGTTWKWEAEAPGYQPRSPFVVITLKRKTGACG